jgi:DNA-binding NtrC family response regulator
VAEILSKLATEMQLLRIPSTNDSVMMALTQYDWPGNVRELRNVLERALMLWDGGPFDIAVPLGAGEADESCFKVDASPDRTLGEVVDEVTKVMCTGALQLCNGNKKAMPVSCKCPETRFTVT